MRKRNRRRIRRVQAGLATVSGRLYSHENRIEALAESMAGRVSELERKVALLEQGLALVKLYRLDPAVTLSPAPTPAQTSPATLSTRPGTVDGGSLATIISDPPRHNHVPGLRCPACSWPGSSGVESR